MKRLPDDLNSMYEALEAMSELLSVLEPCLDYINTSHQTQHGLREAFSYAAAKLADFENGTDV